MTQSQEEIRAEYLAVANQYQQAVERVRQLQTEVFQKLIKQKAVQD